MKESNVIQNKTQGLTQAWLVLESGECYPGQMVLPANAGGWSLAALKAFARAGEVVFNTSHSGYEEIATDPSYFSQIVVFTAPMQGNYGADSDVWESRQLWIEGVVCLEMMNSTRESTWLKRLAESQIPVLAEIDTRRLVQRLRSGGTPWGAVVAADNKDSAVTQARELIAEKKKLEKDWVWLASRKKTEVLKGKNPQGPRLAVLDFGSKENILRELVARASEVHVLPSRASVDAVMSCQPDGLMLTNGPGDPADVQVAMDTTRQLLGRMPIFGICMGHQILGMALGAKTYKLKFGHRGSNHPIKDTLLNKVYMSSQNHGYAVATDSLPSHVKVTHRNLNDQTVAGFYSVQMNCLGIQFHPESHPGPHEATALFDFFINEMFKAHHNDGAMDKSGTQKTKKVEELKL